MRERREVLRVRTGWQEKRIGRRFEQIHNDSAKPAQKAAIRLFERQSASVGAADCSIDLLLDWTHRLSDNGKLCWREVEVLFGGSDEVSLKAAARFLKHSGLERHCRDKGLLGQDQARLPGIEKIHQRNEV